MLSRYVEQLIKELEMEPITSLEGGRYSLNLEPNLQISLRENDPPGITMSTLIGSLPEIKKEDYLLRLMTANLFHVETGRGVLGLDKEAKKIFFYAYLPPEANYKEFLELFEDFANYAESWREETKQYIQEVGTS